MSDVITSGEGGRWPLRLMILTMFVAFGVCFDGFDSLILPPSLPLLSRAWHVGPTSFAPVFALSTIGYAIGSAFAGMACDRVGRRTTLIGSVVVIGVGSFASSAAPGLMFLTVARVIIGIGIGGTLVSAFTIIPEFTPLRWRGAVLAAATLCEPLGGFLASSVCALFLAQYGWRTLFVIGGIVPLVYAGLLAAGLVETPAFLAARPERRPAFLRALARLRLQEADVVAHPRATGERPGISTLFAPRYRHDTLLLWASGFLWLMFLFMVLNWLPTLAVGIGASDRLSATTLAAFTLGSLIGALLSVFFVRPLGTRLSLIIFGTIMTSVSALLAWHFGAPGASTSVNLFLIAALGFGCAGGQSYLFVLFPNVYDVDHRGTGVGFALGVGRLGTIAAAFAGAQALGDGGRTFFLIELLISVGAIICAVSVRAQVAPIRNAAREQTGSIAQPTGNDAMKRKILAARR